jgi:sulfopyruvate decarboxylase TPP-binding subunit
MAKPAAVPTGRPRLLHGRSIIAAVKEAGVRFVVALPDIVTCESVLWPISDDPDLRLVAVCKEDEGVSICAGLSYADRRAVLLIQHTGLLDSVNAIRAIAVEYGLPVVMLVGLQGMESDRMPVQSAKYGIRILEPLLRVMELDYEVVSGDADVDTMAERIVDAYERSRPYVFLIARSPEHAS